MRIIFFFLLFFVNVAAYSADCYTEFKAYGVGATTWFPTLWGACEDHAAIIGTPGCSSLMYPDDLTATKYGVCANSTCSYPLWYNAYTQETCVTCADKVGQMVTVSLSTSDFSGSVSVQGCEVSLTGGGTYAYVGGVLYAAATGTYTGQDSDVNPHESTPIDLMEPIPYGAGSEQKDSVTTTEIVTNPDGSITTIKTTTDTTTKSEFQTFTTDFPKYVLDAQNSGTTAQKTTTISSTQMADGTIVEETTVEYTGYTPSRASTTIDALTGEASIEIIPETVTRAGTDTTITTTGTDGSSSTSTTSSTGTSIASAPLGQTSVGAGASEAGDSGEGSCGILPDVFCSTVDEVTKFFDWVKETPTMPEDVPVPEREFTVEGYSSGLPGDAVCPAPLPVNLGMFGTVQLSFMPICELALAIRPFLIVLAYMMGAYIVIGGRR